MRLLVCARALYHARLSPSHSAAIRHGVHGTPGRPLFSTATWSAQKLTCTLGLQARD